MLLWSAKIISTHPARNRELPSSRIGATTYLVLGSLPSHRQAHGMSLPTVCARISQPRNITQHLAPQVVLNLHLCECGIDLEDLGVG